MKRLVFDIHPDIRRASTILKEFYTESDFFEASKEKIFARCWHLAGRSADVDNILPKTILPGFLDESILMTKEKGEIRCLSNVCTHRGKVLSEKPESVDGIRCAYHGRKFSLDGKFLSMPEFEGVEDFPCEQDDLTRIPITAWRDFLFISLDPVAPFADFAAGIDQRLREFEFNKLEFAARRDYEVKAHWALYCENYLEGFHIPFVHKSLNEQIDYGTYSTETFRYSSLQIALSENGKGASVDVSADISSPFSQNRAAYYFFVFPNLMFNFYPWGISINIVKPLKSDLTTVTYLTFVSDETKLNSGAGSDLETIELEDQAVVESVQKGIKSRFYKRGRYSPKREQGTHHFHRLIAEFMG